METQNFGRDLMIVVGLFERFHNHLPLGFFYGSLIQAGGHLGRV